jgi:uncharacterized protein (TIGR03083 family)
MPTLKITTGVRTGRLSLNPCERGLEGVCCRRVTMESLKPILTAHLLPKLDALLVELLRSLRPDEWALQTVAAAWNVRDVAAHLLDTQLRKLSIARDGYAPAAPPITSHADLVAFINRLNHEGVAMYRRLSAPVLISLMDSASRESAAYHQSLDPFADARFAVSWAGEETSANWFDTAREFSERWHHQQQIRLAVGRAGIMTPELYHPVLDCFMRALPFAYRNQSRDAGTHATFNVSGECGGTWHLYREVDGWRLIDSPTDTHVSETTIPQDIAWLIFTKGMDRESAAARVHVTGNRELGLQVLHMISIVG